MMLFGVEQRGEIFDKLTEHLRDRSERVVADLCEVRSEADRAIRKSQEYRSEYYRRCHRAPRRFEVGTLLL